MPVMNGFAAAKKLKALLPNVPILFLTMHSGASFVSEARRVGVQGFVTKDHAGEVLVEAVKALLDKETFDLVDSFRFQYFKCFSSGYNFPIFRAILFDWN